MSWKPLKSFTDVVEANAQGKPVLVEMFDDAGTHNVVSMWVGRRYRIATAQINVLCTVVGIDHGARYPLTVTYTNEWGDNLKEVFSPNELLRVTPL